MTLNIFGVRKIHGVEGWGGKDTIKKLNRAFL